MNKSTFDVHCPLISQMFLQHRWQPELSSEQDLSTITQHVVAAIAVAVAVAVAAAAVMSLLFAVAVVVVIYFLV